MDIISWIVFVRIIKMGFLIVSIIGVFRSSTKFLVFFKFQFWF